MPFGATPIPIPKELLAPKTEQYYERSGGEDDGANAGEASSSFSGYGHGTNTGIGHCTSASVTAAGGGGGYSNTYSSSSSGSGSNCGVSSSVRALPESDQYAATVTAAMTCRCPHLDAFLPQYLDSGGLGLFQRGENHPLKHLSKRHKRMTISDVHLASILPLHKKKSSICSYGYGGYGGYGGYTNTNTNTNTGKSGSNEKASTVKYSQYTFGDEEKKTDAVMMGGVTEYYTPLHAPTFVEQVEKERQFEADMLHMGHPHPNSSDGGLFERGVQVGVGVGHIHTLNNDENQADTVASELEIMEKKIIEYRSTLFLKTKAGTKRKGRKMSTDFKANVDVSPDKRSVNHSSPALATVSSLDQSQSYRDDELQQQLRQREDDINAALSRVENWLEVIRLNRLKYWKNYHQKRLKKNHRINHEETEMHPLDDFRCKPCEKKSNRKHRSSTLFPKKIPQGDALMQCLDCSVVLCGSGDLAVNTCGKRHLQQHFLLSNHSFAITCGEQANIFCMRCGDYVYNEVFDREIERVEIEVNLPWFAWDRHKTLQRSFGFSRREEDDFVLIPEVADEESPSHDEYATGGSGSGSGSGSKGSNGKSATVVWRGFKATYPNPVPDEIVIAAQRTLQRWKLFRGESPNGSAYLNLGTASAEMALQQHSRYPQKFWSIDCPVGIYNAGNICYISSVLQCIFNLRPVQKYFLRDAKHHHKACAVLRSSMAEKGDKPPSHCLACEMDKLMLMYYGSTVGTNVSPLLESGMNASIPNNSDSNNHNILDHDADITASSSQTQQGMPIVPSDFLVAAWKSNDMLHLAGNDQHDAHEFMQAFLDIIDKDCKRFQSFISEATAPTPLTKKPKTSTTTPDSDKQTKPLDSVSSLFAGNLRSVLMCDVCGYKRSHLEPFLNISLSLPTAKPLSSSRAGSRRPLSRIDVRSCIDLFTDAEPLCDDLFCTWCKAKTKTRKQHTFAKLPPILCLHLKRFCATTTKKIDDQVVYPSTLDMGPYLPHWREIEQTNVMPTAVTKAGSPKSKKSKVVNDKGMTYPTILYDLCGTIDHSGTLNQGHYVANVMVDDDWYSCNDTEVNRLLKEGPEKELAKSEEVYMLFYKRRVEN